MLYNNNNKKKKKKKKEKKNNNNNDNHLTLKMASAPVVETSVANDSPSQDSSHPDDHFQSRHVTPGFKPFS